MGTGKPRPALVVQAGETLPCRESVTICLLTSGVVEAPLFRVRIEPSAANGLSQVSEAMADKIVPVPRELLSPGTAGPSRRGGHGARRYGAAAPAVLAAARLESRTRRRSAHSSSDTFTRPKSGSDPDFPYG
jgi:hypothetical protein